MSESVKIKITKLGRKEFPSKFKEGETYNITTILDEISGRKGSAIGKFADNWKIGDTVDGIWEKRIYKDKDGFEKEDWNIKDPNKKEFKGGGGNWGPKKPSIVDAYNLAVSLVPFLFKDKTITLEKVSKLADEIFKKLSSTVNPDTKKAEGKDVDLNKEEPVKKKEEDSDFSSSETDEDDDEIF